MTKNTSDWSDSIMQEWLSQQQQNLGAWSKINANLSKEGEINAEGLDLAKWYNGLQQWWSACAPVSEQNEQLFQKTVGIGQNYLNLAKQIAKARENDSSEVDLQLWLNMIEEVFHKWSEQLSQQIKDESKAFENGPQKNTSINWEQLRKISQATFSTCDKLQNSFGDFKIPGADETQEAFFNLFDAAEIFSGKSSEKDFQTHLKHFLRYKQASAAYSLILANNSLQAVQKLKEQLQDATPYQTDSNDHSQPKSNAGENSTTLKDLYAKWVQVNEKIYARSALSQEYQQTYGEMINAYMVFKKDVDKSLAEKYKQFNLVSRTELDGFLQNTQQLQRENKALRQQLNQLADRLTAMEKKR